MAGGFYPVPQNAPRVSAEMNPERVRLARERGSFGVNVLNPDPRLSEERRRQESKIFRIGVNFPEGQYPNPEPLFYLGSDSLPLVGLWFGTKATDISPWYGV